MSATNLPTSQESFTIELTCGIGCDNCKGGVCKCGSLQKVFERRSAYMRSSLLQQLCEGLFKGEDADFTITARSGSIHRGGCVTFSFGASEDALREHLGKEKPVGKSMGINKHNTTC